MKIELEYIGRDDENSRLFQGFGGHLVLIKCVSFSLCVLGIFPFTIPVKCEWLNDSNHVQIRLDISGNL